MTSLRGGGRVSRWPRRLAAALADLGIQRAVLVGHSNGVPVVHWLSEFFRPVWVLSES